MFSNLPFDLKCKELNVVLSHYCRINVNCLGESQNERLVVNKTTKAAPFGCGNKLSQTVCFDESNALCLFYSDVEILLGSRVLAPGGVAIFDCKQPLTYTVGEPGIVHFFFIPCQFYDKVTISEITSDGCFIYSIYISYLLGCLDKEDGIMLSSKMLPFIYLLVISVRDAVPNKNAVSFFEKVNEAICAHALDPLFSLDKVAVLFSCSKRTLHYCLSSQGTTYSKIIKDYRVNYFAELLIIERRSRVKALCYKSGFNSMSYAIKQFKATKGLTPKQYRRVFYEQ